MASTPTSGTSRSSGGVLPVGTSRRPTVLLDRVGRPPPPPPPPHEGHLHPIRSAEGALHVARFRATAPFMARELPPACWYGPRRQRSAMPSRRRPSGGKSSRAYVGWVCA